MIRGAGRRRSLVSHTMVATTAINAARRSSVFITEQLYMRQFIVLSSPNGHAVLYVMTHLGREKSIDQSRSGNSGSIVVLTYESLPSNIATAAVATAFPEDVVAIVSESGRPSVREQLRLLRKSPVFFIWKVAEILSYRLLCKLPFRSTCVPGLASIAKGVNADLIKIAGVNDAKVVAKIEGYEPDVIVSIYFPEKIGAAVRAAARKAAINSHGSYLPHNRGLFPYFWTIARDDGHGGVSIHHLDESFDTGPLIAQRRLEPEPEETVAAYAVRSAALSGELLVESIRAIQQDVAEELPNVRERGNYVGWPTLGDTRELWRRGRKLGSPFGFRRRAAT